MPYSQQSLFHGKKNICGLSYWIESNKLANERILIHVADAAFLSTAE